MFAFISSILHSIKQPMIDNSDVQNFVKSHPGSFRFAQHRSDRSKFSGFTLTLLCIVFIYVLLLFLGIIEDIITSDLIVAVDIRSAKLLSIFRHPQLTKIFLRITLLGKWQIVIIFAITISFLCWIWNKRNYILPLWLAIIGSELFDFLGKLAFHRQRPPGAIYIERSFSFPSGHATIATAFYGFITYLFLRNTKRWKDRIYVFFAGIIIILAIGFSRL
ncbi:MAG: phosphatase PAP2 family protein, partial [bacterium]